MKQGRDYGVRRGEGSIAERVTKDGAVRFLARWHDGDRVRSKTFATLDEAEDHLRTVGRAKRGGRYVPDRGMTVADVVDEYITRGERRWSPNTAANYRQIARSIIVPALGRKKATDLTPRMVQTFVDDLGRRYSPRRVEVIRAVLSGAFKEARRLGIVTTNPTEGIRGAKVQRTHTPSWSQDEAARVLATVEDDPEQHAWYMVALTTGMRPGELRALQWKDIDTTRSIIHVRRTVSRDAEFRPVISDGTKTGRVRAVNVPQVTIAALQRYRPVQAAQRLQAAHWRDLDLVWTRGDGNVVPQQTIAKRHKAVCLRAGVPVISPHGVRHTAATLLIEAGVNIKTVSDMLGHARISITLDTYTRATDEMKRSAADTMGELVKRRGSA